jgi:hypothetical protein
MKMKTTQLASLLIIILLVIPYTADSQSKSNEPGSPKNTSGKKIKLFNGKDLNNWVFQLRDPAVDPDTVFTVRDKVIHISGDPFGYMRTSERYSDYKLHVEWRWPSEATNSGIFIHAQLPDKVWPTLVECQLKAGSAGDFVCMSGADMNEVTNKARPVVNKMADSSEKPVGEWNTMEIICDGSTIEVYVNGVMQNKGTNVSVREGSICLQSEGKDIEFRNVYLNKLKK